MNGPIEKKGPDAGKSAQSPKGPAKADMRFAEKNRISLEILLEDMPRTPPMAQG
jgi:hypothetical protein